MTASARSCSRPAGNTDYAAASQVKQTTTARSAAPDLVVTTLSDPPGAAEPGGKFSVTDTVENQGSAAADYSRTQYYLSFNSTKGSTDILLTGTRSISKLNPTATSVGTANVTIPASTPLGTYHVLACADDLGAVGENNEANNCRASAATVQVTRADLRSTVSSPPATASQGSAFRVVDTVTNHGLIAAGMSRTLYYLSRDLVKTVDDQPLSQTRSVPALMPGASSQGEVVVKVPSKTPVGLHYLLACTDENSTVAETDEANNCGASATQVNIVPSGSGTPNLTPYKPSGWSDRIVVAKTTGTVKDATPLRAADTLYVDWAITNDGNAPTAAPFYTELYVDGVLRNAWLTSSLDAKGQFSVLDYAIGTLSPGNHTITIKTDATSVLAEKSKSDNTYTKTIKIAP